MKIDKKYMKRALELAQKGQGNTLSNPMVGAVMVCDDRIIGEGYHMRCGEAHAEVNAINSVSEDDKHLLSKSTIYVTLEPCCHYGKTPPCTELILKVGIPHVVIAMRDPFAKVAGGGVKILRERGVEVTEDILKKEAEFLNRRFICYHTQKRPYIILKWAETIDGYIDTERNSSSPAPWLTGEAAKTLVHKWRSEEDAIMVGANTVLRDNPSLTTRNWFGKNPIRIVIDRDNSLSRNFNIFNSKARTLVFNMSDISTLLKKLYDEGIQSVFVEGGTKTLQKFIDEGKCDEIRRFVSPLTLCSLGAKGGYEAPKIKGAKSHEDIYISNVKLEYYYY